MRDYVPLIVHSADRKEFEFSVPGRLDPVQFPFSDLKYGVREQIRHRCGKGGFPIQFQVYVEEDAASPKDLLPEESHQWRIPPPPPFQALDFRPITRKPEVSRCIVEVDFGYPYGRVRWLTAGQVDLSAPNERGISTLKAYLPAGVTDFEHDSSYAFSFDLVGLQFDHTWYGMSNFKGFLHADLESFRVPDGDYNPMEHPDSWMCTTCAESHPMLPDGFFTPKTSEQNKKLFMMLLGKPLRISIGPTRET